jgi:CRISPR/Cas system-associated exonuclease Cas4 (RecB family)
MPNVSFIDQEKIMRPLSKSKIMAFRQCPKRLWLEVYHSDLKQDSSGVQARFAAGDQVGAIARTLYDPKGNGRLINIDELGFPAVFSATTECMQDTLPIFEAAFQCDGALALVDVLLPMKKGRASGWRMVEVKSSTSVKDVHRDDIAVQAYIAKASGVKLMGVAEAHIDNQWVYPGNGNYRGLLTEVDLSLETFARDAEVETWIQDAQAVIQEPDEPVASTGAHCDHPYPCGFYDYCSKEDPQAEMPIYWLPRLNKQPWIEQGISDLKDIPPEELNLIQQRVQNCTIHGETYFDAQGSASDLAHAPMPGYFLDFETIQYAVPIWAGTRPYQQIPFQFSLHRLNAKGVLVQDEFLDITGEDPSRPFAEYLVQCMGKTGPVFVYSAAFEKSRISELAERFPDLARRLLAINERVVDLLPIARNRYYHPGQQGSWSIKKVLSAVAPELRYDALDGVQDGGMAMDAYLEAIAVDTTPERKAQIQQQLLTYCRLDTYAMVRLWEVFSGQNTKDTKHA